MHRSDRLDVSGATESVFFPLPLGENHFCTMKKTQEVEGGFVNGPFSCSSLIFSACFRGNIRYLHEHSVKKINLKSYIIFLYICYHVMHTILFR